ncbi:MULTISPECIES: hypothetical protein [unclassified Streptomyces]|uniref:hypothetical protein n=1 Tax=unclassified Streptomyces TaxID=2593676 RepID=UPI00364A7C26
MARITFSIEPRHADFTGCAHPVKPSGRPRDPNSGCTGRDHYQVVCSEHGDVGDPHHVRPLAELGVVAHRQEHRAALMSR